MSCDQLIQELSFLESFMKQNNINQIIRPINKSEIECISLLRDRFDVESNDYCPNFMEFSVQNNKKFKVTVDFHSSLPH